MKRSFLNIITLEGKEVRIAEFGFFADRPSFDGDAIIIRRDDKYMRLDLASGMLALCDAPPPSVNHISPDGSYKVSIDITSSLTDGRGYCEMLLRDLASGNEHVLVRFMGCAESIGVMPFSADSKRIAFIGYPADEFGE